MDAGYFPPAPLPPSSHPSRASLPTSSAPNLTAYCPAPPLSPPSPPKRLQFSDSVHYFSDNSSEDSLDGKINAIIAKPAGNAPPSPQKIILNLNLVSVSKGNTTGERKMKSNASGL